jgi:hypothetical protein
MLNNAIYLYNTVQSVLNDWNFVCSKTVKFAQINAILTKYLCFANLAITSLFKSTIINYGGK